MTTRIISKASSKESPGFLLFGAGCTIVFHGKGFQQVALIFDVLLGRRSSFDTVESLDSSMRSRSRLWYCRGWCHIVVVGEVWILGAKQIKFSICCVGIMGGFKADMIGDVSWISDITGVLLRKYSGVFGCGGSKVPGMGDRMRPGRGGEDDDGAGGPPSISVTESGSKYSNNYARATFRLDATRQGRLPVLRIGISNIVVLYPTPHGQYVAFIHILGLDCVGNVGSFEADMIGEARCRCVTTVLSALPLALWWHD